MEKSIENLTQTLLKKLPADKDVYSLNDLEALNLPPFLLRQISNQLFIQFSNSIEIPESDWAELSGETMAVNWSQFKNSAKEYLVLPAGKSNFILNRSLTDCVQLIIRPCRAITDFLFEEDDSAGIDLLIHRASRITINSYLAWALLRYLEKKQRSELSRVEAERILRTIDEKLTAGYNPLNWLALIRPLFELSGSEVNTRLVQLFFEERGFYSYSKVFEDKGETVGERVFIEILSSPGLIQVEGYGEPQQNLFEQPDEINSVTDEAEPDDHELMDEMDSPADKMEPDAPSESEETVLSLYRENDDIDEDQLSKTPEREPDEPLTEYINESEGISQESAGSDREHNDASTTPESVDIVRRDDFAAPDSIDEADSLQNEDTDSSAATADELNTHFQEDSEFMDEAAPQDETAPWEESVFTESSSDLIEDENEGEDTDLKETNEEQDILLSKFVFDDSSESEDEIASGSDDGVHTIYDELRLSSRDRESGIPDLFSLVDDKDLQMEDYEDDEETAGEADKEAFGSSGQDSEEPDPERPEDFDAGAGDDLPMWQSFLERDDPDKEPPFLLDIDDKELSATDKDEPETDEYGYITEPIFDLTRDEPEAAERIIGLSDWMNDASELFIDEIFGGSETAYEQALADILEFSDWKLAARYIEKEIFSRNRIDIYDEIAVDFTDRLHTFFIENRS
ncbi:MAG: hypothetical protein EA360_04830 [Balneolaceae bacterium]|nr:MAG: hypothetical protein EA360_04830 [Balneolaceae bacterium]